MAEQDPHAPFQAKAGVTAAMKGGKGKSFASGNLSQGSSIKMVAVPPVETGRGLCEVCFVTCVNLCSGCKTIRYCCAEHQTQHWKVHKPICAEIRKARAANKKMYKTLCQDFDQKAGKVPSEKPAAAWSVGLSGGKKYEWLVNCYRMRVDDDCTHGGGKKHGLYLVTGKDVASQSVEARTWIVVDFMLFLKLAQLKGVIPFLDWDWTALIAAAGAMLGAPFTKDDAKRRYGSENVFDVASGGRSLRATGDAIYCTSVTNPKYSADPDYLRIKAELAEAFPVCTPLAMGLENIMRPVNPRGGDNRPVVEITGTESILSEVGGVAWAGLVPRLRL